MFLDSSPIKKIIDGFRIILLFVTFVFIPPFLLTHLMFSKILSSSYVKLLFFIFFFGHFLYKAKLREITTGWIEYSHDKHSQRSGQRSMKTRGCWQYFYMPFLYRSHPMWISTCNELLTSMKCPIKMLRPSIKFSHFLSNLDYGIAKIPHS